MRRFMDLKPGAVWDGVEEEFVIIGELSTELEVQINETGQWFRDAGRDAVWIMFDPQSNHMFAFDADKRWLGSMSPPGFQLIRIIDVHRRLFGLVTRYKVQSS